MKKKNIDYEVKKKIRLIYITLCNLLGVFKVNMLLP